MYFEQSLLNDYTFFHQDNHGWLEWCKNHEDEIKEDFQKDLETMSSGNQRYFGDWVSYQGHQDVGYYLGAIFVQFLTKEHSFDELISFDLNQVSKSFYLFAKTPQIYH